jgi:hypothetical protein
MLKGEALETSPRFAMLSTMSPAGNTLDDFPAESFTILVFCDACNRNVPLDRSTIPDDLTIQGLVEVLRCSSCGSRETSIRIVCTGSGGFHYGADAPAPRKG